MSLIQGALLAGVIVQRRRQRRQDVARPQGEAALAIPALPSNMGAWRWDSRTDEIAVAQPVGALFDIADERPVARSYLRAHVHPEDRGRFDELFAAASDREEGASEFRVQTQSGETKWLSGRAQSRPDVAGRTRVTGILMDLTETKQAEARYHQQRLQLAHLTRVAILGQLSGTLAHELIQPLTAILSNAQAAQRFLAAKDANLQEVREILRDIIDDDVRAGDVIRRVRALLVRGETQLQTLDISQLIADVVAIAQRDLEVRQVTLGVEVDQALPQVQADRVQIQQVLLNLLLNASEVLMASPPRDRRVAICARRNEQGVRISVSDTGAGLRKEQLERVFDAFYTTKSNGLGLGLAICRSIVVAHGGRLWATNNEDGGATFYFTLPQTPPTRTSI